MSFLGALDYPPPLIEAKWMAEIVQKKKAKKIEGKEKGLKKRPTFGLRTSCFQPSYHQAYHRQSQERTGRRHANQILSFNSILLGPI
jgi:hypothetical protein